ncbi:MAG: HNH endonuclease [Chloroflexota bacterium]|nr:HNH endonuclease [Chloroflexota bacterium]
MLTHVESFSITLVPHTFSIHGHVRINIGKKTWEWKNWKLTKGEFNKFLIDRYTTPYKFILNNKVYWLFENKLYKDNEGLTHEDVKALLIARKQVQQSRINRAKTLASSSATNGARLSRTAIPDDVKLIVWQRDTGRCVKCGSNVELQYDHIIPFSMGGANTVANIQILCGRCNRAKSNSVV